MGSISNTVKITGKNFANASNKLSKSSAQNLASGLRATPIASQIQAISVGLANANFNKVASNSAILALGSISGSNCSKLATTQASFSAQATRIAAFSAAADPGKTWTSPSGFQMQENQAERDPVEGKRIFDETLNKDLLDHEFEQHPSYFNYGAANIYNGQKLDADCEDGWCVSNDFMCIANGVGNWPKEGYKGFSTKKLVEIIQKEHDKAPEHAAETSEKLFDYVERAVPKTPALGLSTAIVAKLSKKPSSDAVNQLRDGSNDIDHREYYNTVKVAILGDSDYQLFRPNVWKIQDKSGRPQFEQVTCPDRVPRSEIVPFEYGRAIDKEKVKNAYIDEHMLRDKDVFVMGCDTVMDNMHHLEIGDIIHKHLNEDFIIPDVQACVQEIAAAA